MPARAALRSRCRLSLLACTIVILGLGLVAPAAATAQILPTPFDFVSNLDLKCYAIESSSVGLNLKLQLRHLNPVLREMGLGVETVVVGRPQQLCVPVAKNNVLPPPLALRFIQFVDLECFAIDAFTPPTKVALNLRHLNRVLQHLGAPDENVVITRPQQLCVPVAKNNVMPPPEILRLVQHIDLKCYEIAAATGPGPVPIGLGLAHLNPVLRDLGLPDEDVRMHSPKQFCVPVMKNNVAPPHDVFNVVQWVDMKKYTIDAPPIHPVTLLLRHLNPLFGNLQEKVVLRAAEQLGVPVAKNGRVPPNQ